MSTHNICFYGEPTKIILQLIQEAFTEEQIKVFGDN